MPVMQSVAARMIVRTLEKQVRMKSVPVLHGLNRRFAVQGRLGSLVVVQGAPGLRSVNLRAMSPASDAWPCGMHLGLLLAGPRETAASWTAIIPAPPVTVRTVTSADASRNAHFRKIQNPESRIWILDSGFCPTHSPWAMAPVGRHPPPHHPDGNATAAPPSASIPPCAGSTSVFSPAGDDGSPPRAAVSTPPCPTPGTPACSRLSSSARMSARTARRAAIPNAA